MRSFRKDAKVGALILVAALLVAQVIRIDKTNPSARVDSSISVSVKPLLKRACYDCHSNETVWPWYSNVAPVSWLLSSDVNEGRRELNFSEWGNYSAKVQARKMKEIRQEVQEGGMPPWYYSMMHRASHLSPDEQNKITDWTGAASGSPIGESEE